MLLFSPFFDIFSIDPENVVNKLEYWGVHCSVAMISRICDLLFVTVLILTAFFAWKGITYKQRRYIRLQIGAENKQFNSKLSRWLFVDTFYLDTPPSNFDTPETALEQKGHNLIKEFTKRVFKERDNNTLHLVLGGSGMGKSSFLVGALRKYVMHNPWFRHFEIILINLGNADCLQAIKNVEEKANTILLLDALDENLEAASSIDVFMQKLEKEISSFPITVITCRTQFFPDSSAELQTAGICGNGSYKDNLRYRHYYIRYFNDWDVKKYLLKKYPLRPFSYVKARKAVSLCNSLAHRPLLLSYIDDIIKEKSIHLNNELDLYEKLIELWIRREANILSSAGGEDVHKLLKDFSMLLAEKMYRDYQNKMDYYVTGAEADTIISKLGIQGIGHAFKTRSLVERDAEGNYKFAHRTFMEFFMAQIAFANDSFPFEIVGLDAVKHFFYQICYRHIEVQEAEGYVLLGESEPFVCALDQMDIKTTRGGLRLRALQSMPDIHVLSIDCRLLSDVLSFIDGTNIRYLRISGYKRTISLNPIMQHPQVLYLWIDGEECSKSFLKLAAKQEISIIVNDRIALYYERPNCPMDFLASAKLEQDVNNSMMIQLLDYSDNYDE